MFVIVHNNYVIWGPKTWNRLSFQDVLKEECEIEYTLENRNDSNIPIIINENVKILPVVRLPEPEYNNKIQRLDGPFWNIDDEKAEMWYGVADLPVDAVKNFLKGVAANNRYAKEIGGLKLTIQGTEVSIDTARGSRDIFLQTLLAIAEAENISWKFPEGWLSVTKSELQQIVDAGKAHIQSAFAWEQSKVAEIDGAETLAELDAIVLEAE